MSCPRPAGFSRGLLILIAFHALIQGCATLPSVRLARQLPISQSDVPLEIEGPSGALSAGRAADTSEKITDGAKGTLLDAYLGTSAALIGEPLIIGNRVDLLVDGPDTYKAMFEAMKAARRSIDLESYIFDEVEQDGTLLSTLLAARVADGVQVRVLVDGVGSIGAGEMLEMLRSMGVRTCVFNPVKTTFFRPARLNHRDHRKIVVVDSDDAFAGGINFSRVYRSGSSLFSGGRGSSKGATAGGDAALEDGWRDTHVRIRGPGARRMSELFADTWAKQDCDVDGVVDTALAEVPKAGETVIQVIPSSPDSEQNLTYISVLGAVAFARVSIAVTMAYFVPDDRLEAELCAAAGRGVDVRMILPGFSDFTGVFHAGRAHYATLLACGVRLYEQQTAFLHAKTVVVDGVWSTVGSTNWDWRSFVHNDEVSVVVIDEAFAGRMRQLFEDDLANSTEITAEEWETRPWLDRVREKFWTGFEWLL